MPELRHATTQLNPKCHILMSCIFRSGTLRRSVKRREVSACDRTVDASKQGSVSSSPSQSECFPRPEPRGTWLEKWHGTTQSRVQTCWVSFLSGKYRPDLPQCSLLLRKSICSVKEWGEGGSKFLCIPIPTWYQHVIEVKGLYTFCSFRFV
jgi:hypothetical protein